MKRKKNLMVRKKSLTANRMERLTDWAVSLISPKRAWHRAHFRDMARDPEYRQLMLAMLTARGYKNAHNDPTEPNLHGTNQPADKEINVGLNSLTAKQRKLNRDDPIASGLSLTFDQNVIGTGMTPQAITGDDEKNKNIEEVWNELKDNLYRSNDWTHEESQSARVYKILEDGNIFLKKTKESKDDSLWYEMIEQDRLGTPISNTTIEKGNYIRRGVEFNDAGIRVAYWIKKTNKGVVSMANTQHERIPAALVRHLRLRPRRAGQTMGVPFTHAVIQELHDLDLLIIAALKRTQVSSMIAAFLKSPQPTDEILAVTAETYGYIHDETIEPGMIYRMYPDEELQSFIPNFPTSEFDPFIILLCRRIGAALGVSWQIVLKDFSKSNFSSARTDLLESRQTYIVIQKWLIAKDLKHEWFEVLQDARDMGDPRLKGVTDEELRMVSFIPNGWDWVDPAKAALAIKIGMELKITNKRIECARRGLDWQDVIKQSVKEEKFENEERAKEGLEPLPPKDPLTTKELSTIIETLDRIEKLEEEKSNE